AGRTREPAAELRRAPRPPSSRTRLARSTPTSPRLVGTVEVTSPLTVWSARTAPEPASTSSTSVRCSSWPAKRVSAKRDPAPPPRAGAGRVDAVPVRPAHTGHHHVVLAGRRHGPRLVVRGPRSRRRRERDDHAGGDDQGHHPADPASSVHRRHLPLWTPATRC